MTFFKTTAKAGTRGPARALAGLLVMCAAAPSFAQDATQDWDIRRDPARKSILAFTIYDSGLSVAFRCVDESLNVVIAGLPPSRATRQTLRLTFRDAEAHDWGWTTTTNNTVVVGDYPAPLARSFRLGGRLQVEVPQGAADGRNLRHIIDLPASNAAIEEVLTACKRPLVDSRDAELTSVTATGLPVGLDWQRPPRAEFPESRYAGGYVVTTCIANPDGTLRDCQIEMEHPGDGQFGEAVLRAIRRSRVRNTAQPDAPVPGVRVGFRTTFITR